jgi:hypothetical protein
MKYFNKKRILKYLYDQLTGNFAGFNRYFPLYKYKVFRWFIQKEIQPKTKELILGLNNKRLSFFSSINDTLKNTFSKSVKP